MFLKNELKGTRKLNGNSPMVAFINNQAIVATADGNLRILSEKLIMKQKLSDGKKRHLKTINFLSGCENFIASGDGSGTIRFYKKGDKEPQVKLNISVH